MSSILTNDDFASLGRLPSLRVLSFQNSGLQSDTYRHFRRLKQLEDLHTFGAAVDDTSAAFIPQLPQLRFLAIDQTKITPEAIQRLLITCPELTISCDSQRGRLSTAENAELDRRYSATCERERLNAGNDQ